MNTLPDTFEFLDYRKYLSEYYKAKKEANPGFSYAVFSDRAGFANKGFLHNVIHGSKNLSKQSVLKLNRSLKHSRAEADYFENLVFYNQAVELDERNLFYENMVAVRSRNPKAVEKLQLRKEQYEFYSEWYHSAVRSVIGMSEFSGDFAWLARQTDPRILPKQARRSVALLEELGLVRMNSKGVYELTDTHITTGGEIIDLAALNFHRAATTLAGRAIDHLPKSERNITGMTIGASRKAYREICDAASEFRRRVVGIVDRDTDTADRVYQLNIHLFPFSKRLDREK